MNFTVEFQDHVYEVEGEYYPPTEDSYYEPGDPEEFHPFSILDEEGESADTNVWESEDFLRLCLVKARQVDQAIGYDAEAE